MTHVLIVVVISTASHLAADRHNRQPCSIVAAREILRDFIDPVITGRAVGVWHPEACNWS